MQKFPALMFYTGDWLRDGVARCSLAAQGLWLRMMILAHESKQYGYLSENGLPIGDESITRACGCTSLDEYRTLLSELDRAGVPSRTPKGVIYSRRMVRDAKLRATRRKLGKLGGNPKLSNSNLVNQKVNQNTEGENEKVNWFGLWIDINRERKRADPLPLGPDLAAAKRLAKAVRGDAVKFRILCVAYLEDKDVFLLNKGHALQFLSANKYLNAQEKPNGTYRQGFGSPNPARLEGDVRKYDALAARAVKAAPDNQERVDESKRVVETGDGSSVPF